MNLAKVNEHIVNWLNNYAESAGVKGFIVGVSGGVDSALTSTLCAQTGYPTLCVEMPIHQNANQVSRAQEHIAQLKERYPNTDSIRIDLSDSFDTFKTAVPKGETETITALSEANTRARLRMTTLYYLAGIHNRLVAGTGNKVEDFGVGFYTKYGDGGVDLSPIADLFKSEVFALAAHTKVPKSILEAAPTDGLFGDSRTDEDQIGATYDELEWAMKMQDRGKSISDFQDRQKEVFKIYSERNRANKHKMDPIPVCIIPKELN
jgi:NAD+ synthase